MNNDQLYDIEKYLGNEGITENYKSHCALKNQMKQSLYLGFLFIIVPSFYSSNWINIGVFEKVAVVFSILLGFYLINQYFSLKDRAKESLKLTYILFNKCFGEGYEKWLDKNKTDGYFLVPGHYGSARKLHPKANYKGRLFNKSIDLGDSPLGHPVFKSASKEDIELPYSSRDYDFIASGAEVWSNYELREKSLKILNN